MELNTCHNDYEMFGFEKKSDEKNLKKFPLSIKKRLHLGRMKNIYLP